MAAQPKTQFNVRLSPADIASLSKLAKVECRSRADTIRHLIRRAVAALRKA